MKDAKITSISFDEVKLVMRISIFSESFYLTAIKPFCYAVFFKSYSMWVKCAQACTAGSAFVLFEDSRLGEQGATLASQQLLHDQDQGGGLVVDGITYHCCHPKSDT